MATTTSKFLLGLHEGYGSAATFTGSAQTGFPASNLADWSIFNKRWRGPTGSLSALDVDMDLGANVEANVIILAAVNLTLAATYRLRAGTVSGFGSGVVIDTTATPIACFNASLGPLVEVPRPHGRHVIYVAASSVTFRYVRWTLTDAANPDNYLSAAFGRVTLGFQPGLNMHEGWERSAKVIGAPGAQKMLRGHRTRLHRVTRAEAAKFESIAETATETRRLLVLPEPLAPETHLDDAIVATCEGSLRRQKVPRTTSPVRYEIEGTFREVER